VAARAISQVLTRRMMRKSAAMQELNLHGAVKLLVTTQIPASVKALIECPHAPRSLSAARVAAKSEGA
jgi:hypothetical protein